MSNCLSFCMLVCRSELLVCPYTSISPSIYLYLYMYMSISVLLSLCVSLSKFAVPSACLSVCISVGCQLIYMYMCVCVCYYVFLSVGRLIKKVLVLQRTVSSASRLISRRRTTPPSVIGRQITEPGYSGSSGVAVIVFPSFTRYSASVGWAPGEWRKGQGKTKDDFYERVGWT